MERGFRYRNRPRCWIGTNQCMEVPSGRGASARHSDHLSCYPVYTMLHTDTKFSGLHRNASVSALMKLTPVKWQNSDKVMAMFIVTR